MIAAKRVEEVHQIRRNMSAVVPDLPDGAIDWGREHASTPDSVAPDLPPDRDKIPEGADENA